MRYPPGGKGLENYHGAVAQSVEQRTENPCVGGSIPPHTTEDLTQMSGPFFMWIVYVLYSVSAGKSYVGFTNDVERRLFEHNVGEVKGFTLRYRPWALIRTETFDNKGDAMARERFFKTGRGREELRQYVKEHLDNGAVSASAEKD